MHITSLRLINFRNYKDRTFTFSPQITVFGNVNGIGKTNILEGIYVAAVGKSHRTTEDRHMIRFGQEEASVTLDFVKNEVPHRLFIKLMQQGRKTITMDENRLTQKELVGTLQAVFFSPEDLRMIKGSPTERRHFLDLEISQTSPAYYQQLLVYQRALKQRNRVLKESYGKKVSLAEWDTQIAQAAAFITQKRLRALEKMTLLSNLMHRRITEGKENLKLIYEQPYRQAFQDWVIKTKQSKRTPGYLVTADEFYEALQMNLERDRHRMTTSIGPHRDDFIFSSDFGNLKYYGSQGQQRTAALALKLSELEFIKSEVGEYPVLLLDDVLSELDQERRNNLIAYIKSRIQTFITTTEGLDFQAMKGVTYIDLMESETAGGDTP